MAISLSRRNKAERRPVNLRMDKELVEDAKALGVNLSAAAERGVAAAVKAEKEAAWKREHAAWIAERNRKIDEEGLPFEPEWLDDDA